MTLMPNWVENWLLVSGRSREEIDAFERGMVDTEHVNGDVLSFHALVPMPEIVQRGGADRGNGWCVEKWGTKWDASQTKINRKSPTTVDYHFDTAWSPPDHWFRALVARYPKLDLELRFWEHGNTIAGFIYPKNRSDGIEIASRNYHQAQVQWFGTYPILCDLCEEEARLAQLPPPTKFTCTECQLHICRHCSKRDDAHVDGKCLFEPTQFVALGRV